MSLGGAATAARTGRAYSRGETAVGLLRAYFRVYLIWVDAEARQALRVIRRCVARGRYRVLEHFVKRMDARGMFWADVVAVLDNPQEVRDEGFDRWARPKWILEGTAPDGLPIGIVCVIDEEDQGEFTVFITIYWSEG